MGSSDEFWTAHGSDYENVQITFRKLEGKCKPAVNRGIPKLLQKDHYSDTWAHIFINIEMSMVFLAQQLLPLWAGGPKCIQVSW